MARRQGEGDPRGYKRRLAASCKELGHSEIDAIISSCRCQTGSGKHECILQKKSICCAVRMTGSKDGSQWPPFEATWLFRITPISLSDVKCSIGNQHQVSCRLFKTGSKPEL
jgi:hypothetical protein